MFLDGLSMLVVTIPIVYPVIKSFGFDPIWFGVVAVIVIEMGMITPPVGLNVFVVRGVARDVPMVTVFRVITSYSIHYTKLYERSSGVSSSGAACGYADQRFS